MQFRFLCRIAVRNYPKTFIEIEYKGLNTPAYRTDEVGDPVELHECKPFM